MYRVQQPVHKKIDDAASWLALACRKPAPKQRKHGRRTKAELLPIWIIIIFSTLKNLKMFFNLQLWKVKLFYVIIYDTLAQLPKSRMFDIISIHQSFGKLKILSWYICNQSASKRKKNQQINPSPAWERLTIMVKWELYKKICEISSFTRWSRSVNHWVLCRGTTNRRSLQTRRCRINTRTSKYSLFSSHSL